MTVAPLAIIGAGIAGLACARVLVDHGRAVQLFDKARGPGGRLANRRVDETVFDLGAQHFTARHPAFRQALSAWRDAGLVAPWPTRPWRVTADGWQPAPDAERFTAVPRMSALARHLAEGLEVHTGQRIIAIRSTPEGWWLAAETNAHHGPFAGVVLALPTPQAAVLLGPIAPELAAACTQRPMTPCWAACVRFSTRLPTLEAPAPDWQTAAFPTGPLHRVIRNHTKPGRHAQSESLTLLADVAWSIDHLEDDPDTVAAALLAAFAAQYPAPLPAAELLTAHRWRYAQPVTADSDGPGYRSGGNGLALCGDAWRDGRIEDAWLSGHALGHHLATRLADKENLHA
ncbi:MAG: Dehydrosqualene desaturase [Halomonadaceae bacterium T82-2]|nr:MAG: Dehydrosqualene desaturase [Halomonadaceae bacterium T82-2]